MNLKRIVMTHLPAQKPIPAEFITDPGPGGVGEIEREGRAELAAQEAEQLRC